MTRTGPARPCRMPRVVSYFLHIRPRGQDSPANKRGFDFPYSVSSPASIESAALVRGPSSSLPARRYSIRSSCKTSMPAPTTHVGTPRPMALAVPFAPRPACTTGPRRLEVPPVTGPRATLPVRAGRVCKMTVKTSPTKAIKTRRDSQPETEHAGYRRSRPHGRHPPRVTQDDHRAAGPGPPRVPWPPSRVVRAACLAGRRL